MSLRRKLLCLAVIVGMAVCVLACHPTPPVHHHKKPKHPPRGVGWNTCYIKNHAVEGVWSVTSHSRYHAKANAFKRCRHQSGKPSNCYLNYCQEW